MISFWTKVNLSELFRFQTKMSSNPKSEVGRPRCPAEKEMRRLLLEARNFIANCVSLYVCLQTSLSSLMYPNPAFMLIMFTAPVLESCRISRGHSCYIISSHTGTWQENRRKCERLGGDLISMETEGEWAFIKNQLRTHNTVDDEWHIGLKKNNRGHWEWVSGRPLTINKWQREQRPHQLQDEPSGDGPYTVMSKSWPPGTQGLFNDLPNTRRRGYICEKPLGWYFGQFFWFST